MKDDVVENNRKTTDNKNRSTSDLDASYLTQSFKVTVINMFQNINENSDKKIKVRSFTRELNYEKI